VSGEVELLAAMLGEPIDPPERIGRGRNSRVYRVQCRSGAYAAKFYFQKTADGRNRLEVEYGALSFLWGLGVRCIARPVVADAQRQVALYAFVDGAPIELSSVGASDLDQIAEFAGALKQVAAHPSSAAIAPAAEAFFSPRDVIANVEARLRRLEALDLTAAGYEELRAFLRKRFAPSLAALRTRVDASGDASAEHPIQP
jgi:Ser/Thr protein kinase RdoA (MazF antagonist)